MVQSWPGNAHTGGIVVDVVDVVVVDDVLEVLVEDVVELVLEVVELVVDVVVVVVVVPDSHWKFTQVKPGPHSLQSSGRPQLSVPDPH